MALMKEVVTRTVAAGLVMSLLTRLQETRENFVALGKIAGLIRKSVNERVL